MDITNFGYMYDLRCKKINTVFIFIICILSFSSISAQIKAKDNVNYFGFQNKNYYFGISPIGASISRFRIDRSSQFALNDSISIIESASKPGYVVNLIGNIKIGEYFDFRFVPGFSFMFRSLTFQTASQNSYQKTIESVNLEVPMLVRFKSAPFHDKRLFVIGGIKYSYDVASNSRVRRELADDLIQISPHDFSVEAGAGIQIFFPYFIFSPEIKISQGVGNIHIFKNNLTESQVLDQLLSKVIQISFHFEG